MSNDLSFTSADAILTARADRHTQRVALADRIIDEILKGVFPMSLPLTLEEDNIYRIFRFDQALKSYGYMCHTTHSDDVAPSEEFMRLVITLVNRQYFSTIERREKPRGIFARLLIPENLGWGKERVDALAGSINSALVDPTNDIYENFEVIIHLSPSEYTYLQSPECPITAALKLAGFSTRFEVRYGGARVMLVDIAEKAGM